MEHKEEKLFTEQERQELVSSVKNIVGIIGGKKLSDFDRSDARKGIAMDVYVCARMLLKSIEADDTKNACDCEKSVAKKAPAGLKKDGVKDIAKKGPVKKAAKSK